MNYIYLVYMGRWGDVSPVATFSTLDEAGEFATRLRAPSIVKIPFDAPMPRGRTAYFVDDIPPLDAEVAMFWDAERTLGGYVFADSEEEALRLWSERPEGTKIVGWGCPEIPACPVCRGSGTVWVADSPAPGWATTQPCPQCREEEK